MPVHKKYIIISALIMMAGLSAVSCNKNETADPGAPSRRTNAVIVSGTDTTGVSQAYAWINGAAIPLGNGVNPSEASHVRVWSTNTDVLFSGYQNNGSMDKALLWHYKEGRINTIDLGQGPIASYPSRAKRIGMKVGDRYYYAAGTYTPAGDWAILWKIDAISKTVESVPLSDLSQAPASAERVNPVEDPILVAGFVTVGGVQTACYWSNPAPGVPNRTLVGDGLNPSRAFTIHLYNSALRVHGFQNDGANDRACVWVNLVRTDVGTVLRNSIIFAGYSDYFAGVGPDNTGYLSGYETNAAGREVACYWIATAPPPVYTRYDLGQADRDSRALGIWKFEGRVYVTGYEYSAAGAAAGNMEACMWIDGAKTVLSPGRAGVGTGIWDPYFNMDPVAE